MKWRKLGQIFNPTEQPTLPFCHSFAQSPQTLVFDDFVRIYFSTRQQDAKSGKFLSHVSFVEFTKDFRNILNLASHPVIPLGELGTFDEHGIFPINPIFVGDQVYAYTCGWSRRVSVPVETGIGLAISDDRGLTFKRHGSGPVLSASLNQPCLVGDGFVRKYGNTFHMWYIFGLPWKVFPGSSEPERIYKIGYGTSANGIDWQKRGGEQLIQDAIGSDECQALPTVLRILDRYHMYFCYRHPSDFRTNSTRGYRIGYAYSDDLTVWTRDDKNAGIELSPNCDDWDSEMMCYPHIFECDEKVYMLYNGNNFGRTGFGLAVAEG